MIESRRLAFALGFAVALGAACDGDDRTSPSVPGAIEATATTAGADLDPDGYTVQVGDSSEALGLDASITFGDLNPGEYTVELTEMSANCTAAGLNPRTVTVSARDTTRTTFDVTCVPTTGSLEVTASTTGDDLDPDGYTVTVDGGAGQSVAINGSTTFTGLAAGDHDVELTGLASNCTVDGSNPRAVTITAGDAAMTTFDVTCAQLPICSKVFVAHDSPTTLSEAILSTDPITFDGLGTANITYNAIGFRPAENSLYGIQNQTNTLVLVNFDGSTTALGAIAGLPSGSYNAGEFAADGLYYVKGTAMPAAIFRIDVDAVTVTTVTLSQATGGGDMAWFNGLLYTVDSQNLVSIDPVNGAVTTIGPTGRTEDFGAMFGAPNGIFGLANSGGLVRFDPGTGAGTLLAASPGIQNSDAAKCVTTEVPLP